MRVLLLTLTACGSGKVVLGDIADAEDIQELCADHEPEEVSLEVTFPAQTESCPWGEGDNLPEMSSGRFTARAEQTQGLELPEDVLICDMVFNFSGLLPGDVQIMVYDDHFFFTFNDIILASSYGAGVRRMEESDGLHRFQWPVLVGQDYHVDEGEGPYCLGEESNASTCDIPDTEVEGPIALAYDEALTSRLSLSAVADQRYDFAFIATGDDDPATDCQHEAFSFTVDIPYLEASR